MAKENLSIPRGTRDFGPQQMLVRNHIFSTIKSVFQSFGFAPLETPAMENLSVLTGKYGDEGDQLIYKVLNSGDFLSDVKPEDFSAGYKPMTRKVSEKALRYDLTVPLARYVVMNRHALTFPFKRYQMQPVWRADRPSFGRYREFYQCDADVVGTQSLLCEVEIIQMMVQILEALQIHDYVIKINHRKILAGLVAWCGAPSREAEMSVSLDKLDKIEWEKVAAELISREFSEDFVSKLQGLIQGTVPMGGEAFEKMKATLSTESLAEQGFADLSWIAEALTAFPLMKAKVVFDLTLARGLSYYTGPIFEIVPQGVKVGSISGGGRYDELTSVFGMDGVPGVGFSFGIDRMYDLMEELNLLKPIAQSLTQVLIVQFDVQYLGHYLKLARVLRSADIATEIYPDAVKMKKQFAYADSKQIPWTIAIGETEVAQDNLSLKNMKTGEQKTCSLDEAMRLMRGNH